MAYLNTDIPELKGFDTGLCLSNLDVLGARMNRVNESALAVLDELAEAIVHDAGGDPDTVDSILLSIQGMAEDGESVEEANTINARISALVAPVNRALIGRLSEHAGIYARLILYRFIEERMAGQPANHAQAVPSSPLPATTRGRIAYMPGAFADKAYLHLAACVPNARAAFFHSFVDACEEVHGGLCEYCILPLENTQSGKLTAFSRLILRYGFCIVAVCDLENGAAEGQTTRFALLRKATDGFFPAPLTPHTEHGDSAEAPALCMELLHTTAAPSFTELLLAAEFCGLTLFRADTLPRFEELTESGDADGSPFICCVLNADGADVATFRRFLTLEASEDILMGLYGVVSS